MKSRCDELRGLLSGYRDGELEDGDRRAVEAHLAGCETCREALASYELADAALSAEVVRDEAAWERLAVRVEKAIARDAPAPSPPPRPARRGFSLRPLAFGSLGTLAAALLVFLLHPWRGEIVPEVEMAAKEKGFREQVVEGDPAAPEQLRSLGYPSSTEKTPGTLDEIAEAPAREGRARETKREVAPRENRPTPATSPVVGFGEAEEVVRAEGEALAQEPNDLARKRSRLADGPQSVADIRSASIVRRAPPGGASSARQVEEWARRQASAPSALRPGLAVEGATEADEATASLGEALDLARTLVVRGRDRDGREGFELLTGDFPGNTVRDEAWHEWVRLRTESVIHGDDPGEILPVAHVADAFAVTFPHSAWRDEVLDRRARLWARLAALDAGAYCSEARRRAAEWESRFPDGGNPETRARLRELRDQDCPG